MCMPIYFIFSNVIVWLQETRHTNYVFFMKTNAKLGTVGNSGFFSHARWVITKVETPVQ